MQNPIADRWYPLIPHPTQHRLYSSPVRFPIVPAGRRSGKTELAKRYVCSQALTQDTKYKENFYFCGAPVRDQAKRIYWADIKALTRPFWRKPPQETSLEVYTEFQGLKSTVQVVGLDKPERMEGSPWNGGVIDEMRKIKKHTWGQHVRPALADRAGWCWRCGVPEGRNHYYESAIKAAGGIPQTIPGVGVFAQGDDPEQAYYSWHSADILPPYEIESAKRELEPKLFKQEYEGSFESFEGLVYYAYTADYYPHGNLDDSAKYDPALPIYLGFDFNVDPMTAVLCHLKTCRNGDNAGQKELIVFKGYHLRNSNTKGLIERILLEYGSTDTFYITTCQSASARQTVADVGTTDKKIIFNTLRNAGKTAINNTRSKNPAIKDKVNSLNSFLYHNRIRINKNDNGLKELCRDFDSLVWKEGTSDIDSSDKMRGHISDALAYIVEKMFPIRYEGNGIDIIT